MRGNSETTFTKLQRIAELSKQNRAMAFTSLNHLLDMTTLTEALTITDRTRKAVPGVDGVTADEYADGAYDRLRSLLERVKAGTYRAPPVQRAYIPRARGRKSVRLAYPRLKIKCFSVRW